MRNRNARNGSWNEEAGAAGAKDDNSVSEWQRFHPVLECAAVLCCNRFLIFGGCCQVVSPDPQMMAVRYDLLHRAFSRYVAARSWFTLTCHAAPPLSDTNLRTGIRTVR